MDREGMLELLATKPAAVEEFPFGDGASVWKVGGKMFALVHLAGDASVNLKCDPEWAVELRTIYPKAVLPGYHMSKRHWNTVVLDATIPDDELRDFVDHSYELVVAALPKRVRDRVAGDVT